MGSGVESWWKENLQSDEFAQMLSTYEMLYVSSSGGGGKGKAFTLFFSWKAKS
jgi:hypothetical protein